RPPVMRGRDKTTRAGIARLAVALLVAASTVLALPVSSVARPTQGDVTAARQGVAAAKARLAQLNDRQSLLDEQYDQAQIALASAEKQLAEARTAALRSAATAKSAQADLSARVRMAYEGSGARSGRSWAPDR